MTAMTVRDAAAVSPLARPPRRRRRRRSGDHAGPVAYVLLVVTSFLFLAPFYYMVVAASRPMSEMNQFPPPLTPGNGLWRNILSAWDAQPLGLAIWNSLLVSSIITVTTVLLCTLSGYAFAKQQFTGKKTLFALTVGTMMIPPTLGIVLPIARPGMAVLAMLTFMAAWNDFFWPVIALVSSNPTVQVALKNLGSGYVPDQAIIMAGTLPVVVVFVLLGRQIVSGIMAGAVKG